MPSCRNPQQLFFSTDRHNRDLLDVSAPRGGRHDPLTRFCPVPNEAAIRRILARIDADALDQALGHRLNSRGSRAYEAGCRAASAGVRVTDDAALD